MEFSDEESMDDFEDWTRPSDFDKYSPISQVTQISLPTGKQAFAETHGRVVIHIDIDCFYAQVEMLRNPDLRNKPIGIQQKYIVVTCNYKAREFGVTKLMLIKDAKEKCPNLILVSGEDLTHYREMSYKISEFLQKYCPKVERLGFDENFMDVTEIVRNRLASGELSGVDVTGHLYQPVINADVCACGCHKNLIAGSQLAAEVREALHEELGITCCAGIANNKLLSKLVAGCHKPNQQTVMFPQHTARLMGQLKSVRNIPGIGHTTSRRLREMNIVSVEDLQNAELSSLEREFGKTMAKTMIQLSVGTDDSPVVPFGLPQTLSDEDSFKKCSTEFEVVKKIRELINSLLTRLKDDGRTPQTLRLTVRKTSAANKFGNRESRQCPIPSSIKFSSDTSESCCSQLEQLALSLFHRLVNVKQAFHLTLINVAFTKLEQKAENTITNFFSPVHLQSTANSTRMYVSPSSKLVANNAVGTIPDKSAEDIASDNRSSSEDGANNHSPNMKQHLFISQSSPRTDKNHNLKSVHLSYSDKKPKGLMKWFTMSPPKAETENREVASTANSGAAFVSSTRDSPSNAQGISEKRKSTGFFSSVQKRSKTSLNKQQTCKQIPDNIDRSVFHQLPPEIQQEILNSSNNSSRETLGVKQESVHDEQSKPQFCKTGLCSMCDQQCRKNSHGSCIHVCPFSERITGCDIGTNRRTREECYNKREENDEDACRPSAKTNADTSKKDTSACKSDENDVNSGKTIKTSSAFNVLDDKASSSNENSSDAQCYKKEEEWKIPPDVDPSVFKNLPQNIQKELVNQWKAESAIKKMKTKPAQSGILDFFVKHTK